MARALALLLVLWPLLAARAEGPPRAACSAVRAGRRVVVRPEARDFVDAELARLVRLGLAGKLELTVTLVRARPLWFDERLARVQLVQQLTWSERDGWALDARGLPDGPALLPLERVALDAPRDATGGLHVDVEVRLQVVTAQSLGRVAQWLTGGREGERSAVADDLVRRVAEDLARSARARCLLAPP